MFDYTYRKVFNPAAYRRTWVEIGFQDAALRNSCVVGFVAAYIFGAIVLGRYPVPASLLEPGVLNFPIVILAGIWLYFLAWTADQAPVRSRQIFLVSAIACLLGYLRLLQLQNPPSSLPYMGFVVFFAIVAVLAGLQLYEIKHLAASNKSLRRR